MSRYEELSLKAAAWSRRHFDNLHACGTFARNFAREYASFLGAPSGAVKFIDLDGSLKYGETRRPIGERPRMVAGRDGALYFAIEVALEHGRYGSCDRFQLGVRRTGTHWDVTWEEEQFSLADGDIAARDSLFQVLLNDSLRGYEFEAPAARRRIGFVPVEYDK